MGRGDRIPFRSRRIGEHRVRGVDVARLAYGACLVARPQALARALGVVELGQRASLVARGLGLRHVFHAVVLLRNGNPRVRLLGHRVDGLHALAMLIVAAWEPSRQRVALTDALVTAALGADLHAARPGRPQPRLEMSPVGTSDLLDVPPAPHPFGLSEPANTDPAGDPSTRRRRNARLQRAIHEAYLAAKGADVSHVRNVLTAALAEQGLTAPSPQWLHAAASEIASGYIYVVTDTAMHDAGLELPPHHPV